MNRIRATRDAVWTVALLLAALAAVVPGTAEADRLATPTVYAGGVDFLPHVDYDGARVSVAGQGLSFERSFGAGERLSIGLFDPDGQLLPDGVYTWRLELTPARAPARELRRAARQNGGSAFEPWEAMNGAFAIHGGLVADPSLRERRPDHERPAGPYSSFPADLGSAARGDRFGDDSDEATAAGRAPVASATTDRAAAPGADRTIAERTDAATLAAGPAPAERAANDQSRSQQSWLTDGKNGRDQ